VVKRENEPETPPDAQADGGVRCFVHLSAGGPFRFCVRSERPSFVRYARLTIARPIRT